MLLFLSFLSGDKEELVLFEGDILISRGELMEIPASRSKRNVGNDTATPMATIPVWTPPPLSNRLISGKYIGASDRGPDTIFEVPNVHLPIADNNYFKPQ